MWTPIQRRQELAIDEWVDPPPDEPKLLPLWDDWELECHEATPPRPTIYVGKAGSRERYRSMSQYCYSLTTTNVYGDDDDNDSRQPGPSRSTAPKPAPAPCKSCFMEC